MGALSALPVINLCCCLWILGGGVIAAYLLQDQEPAPISAGDGATVGLIAGLVGAVISLIISVPFTLLMAPMRQQAIQDMLQSGRLPPEVERFASGAIFGALGMVMMFVGMLVGVANIVAGLTFFPALALGPMAEGL